LTESGAYPRDFGYAVASLFEDRKSPLQTEISNFGYAEIGDDLGCLDDILRGSNHTWWRTL